MAFCVSVYPLPSDNVVNNAHKVLRSPVPASVSGAFSCHSLPHNIPWATSELHCMNWLTRNSQWVLKRKTSRLSLIYYSKKKNNFRENFFVWLGSVRKNTGYSPRASVMALLSDFWLLSSKHDIFLSLNYNLFWLEIDSFFSKYL